MDRIQKLNELLLGSPGDSFLQHAMALEYIKTGNDIEARKLFEAILAQEPGYVGSYYHLGKLLERNDIDDEAIKVYQKGMEEAKKVGDDLSYRELKGAWEELSF